MFVTVSPFPCKYVQLKFIIDQQHIQRPSTRFPFNGTWTINTCNKTSAGVLSVIQPNSLSLSSCNMEPCAFKKGLWGSFHCQEMT